MVKHNELNKRLWTVLIFLIKFMALALPLHLILWINLDTTSIQELTAQNTYYILKLFNQDIHLSGIVISTPTFAFQFLRDCTAWKSILAFVALVFATPLVRQKSRWFALLWGIPSIYLLNLVRTSTTIYVGIFYPSTLGFVHTFLWREGLIGIIFVFWLLWFKYNRDISLENHKGLDKFTYWVNRIRK